MMRTSIRATQLGLCTLIVGALMLVGSIAQAQANPALASRGKSLFTSRGCTGCHSIGKGKQAGPDLLGVTDRRSVDWLKRWLHAPESMYDSDSIAKGLLADAKGIKMPNLRLNDADIDALISYLAAESQKKH